jgi:hypothetical protein
MLKPDKALCEETSKFMLEKAEIILFSCVGLLFRADPKTWDIRACKFWN